MKSNSLFVIILSTVCSFVQAQTANRKAADLPAGYWPLSTSQPIIEKIQTIYLSPDLVSLFVAEALQKKGFYTKEQLRSVYASGIRRVLQENKPRRSQPYNTMQLMQWNYFMDNGLLAYDRSTQKLKIDYDKYHGVVGKLLTAVLDIQYQGDKDASNRFIEQYTKWDDNLHGAIAKNIRDQQTYRFRLFRYGALGEKHS